MSHSCRATVPSTHDSIRAILVSIEKVINGKSICLFKKQKNKTNQNKTEISLKDEGYISKNKTNQ